MDILSNVSNDNLNPGVRKHPWASRPGYVVSIQKDVNTTSEEKRHWWENEVLRFIYPSAGVNFQLSLACFGQLVWPAFEILHDQFQVYFQKGRNWTSLYPCEARLGV